MMFVWTFEGVVQAACLAFGIAFLIIGGLCHLVNNWKENRSKKKDEHNS